MGKEGYSDISIKMSASFMKCIGLWMADNAVEVRRRKIALGYTVWTMLFATVIEVRDMYFSWGDMTAVLYVSCNVLSLITVLIKVTVVMARKVEFIELILYMKKHLWSASYNHQEKQILAYSRRKCILFTFFVTLTGHGAVLGYLITPIVANVGKNESDRILPFNMWLDLPLSITPYYEIMFLVQTITVYQVTVCYFSFDNILCILSVHVSGQFRILQYRLANLCNQETEMEDQNANADLQYYADKSHAKLKACIQQHQGLIAYCAKMENVFTLIILGQVLVFSVLICLFGYQIFLAKSSFARRCIFFFTTSGSIFLLFMFTYSCNGLIEQSDNVGTAAYSASWTLMPMNESGKMIRNDLMFTMLRSKRTCCLTANGFFPVSLETYTTILSTAVSYFTLLRQSVEDGIES